MPNLRPSRPSLPLLIAALTPVTLPLISPAIPCAAQTPAPPPASQTAPAPAPDPTFLARLRAAEWDAATRGPLLVVVPSPFVNANPPLPRSRVTLYALGTAARLRLVTAGSVTTLAPRMMDVINTRPGKANPFAGMRPGETLALLLASLSRAQWQQVGSSSGIGQGDLNDDQRLLWAQVMPEKDTVFKGMYPAPKPTEAGEPAGEPPPPVVVPVQPRATGRLRLSKTIKFSFYKVGVNDTSWGGDPYQGQVHDGGMAYLLQGASAYSEMGKLPNSAYGVQIVSSQSSRLKPGAVDFATPLFQVPVPLTDFPVRSAVKAAAPARMRQADAENYVNALAELQTLPTVGDLLLRISTATRVEFVADRRVRDLPVYLRGDSARAGDLLQALCGSVGGTFRAVPAGGPSDTAPLYLLTDDVAGVGARAARLAEWGEAAESVKRRLTDGASEAAAKNDPLSALSFAPGDVFALPEAQAKRVEDTMRRQKFVIPDTTTAEMTPALREAVRRFADDRLKENVYINTDRVKIGEEVRPYLLLPEIGGDAVEAPYLRDVLQNQYLERIAYDPTRQTTPAPANTAKPPAAAPVFADPALKNQRRVVIARPTTPAEAAAIVRATIGRGITAVWLETSLADPKAAVALLTAATKAGGTKVAVGGVVRLLRDSGLPGEADRNILGETGSEFRTRRIAEYADDKKYLDSYASRLTSFTQWIVPGADDAAEMRRRVSVIAAVPGLAGLTFRATGGPGWTGLKRGGDGLWTNSAQGYTPALRRAFLRDRGIDPVDIVDLEYGLSGVRWDLGYFRTGEDGEYEIIDHKMVRRSGDVVPRTGWWEFRQRRNTEMLAALYQSVRKEHPTLPLYLEDRNSGYASPNTPWFGTWDAADRLPNTDPYPVESETRAAARSTSRLIFAHWDRWFGADDAAKADAPQTFARRASESALRYPPPAWDGVVIDLSGTPGGAVAGLLAGLPASPPKAP